MGFTPFLYKENLRNERMKKMNWKKVMALLLALLFIYSTAACTQSKGVGGLAVSKTGEEAEVRTKMIEVVGTQYPLTIRDDTGYETFLEQKPVKVAVLSGTPLNIWYDLGGKSICTSNISGNVKVIEEYRDEIKSIPSVGAVYSVDMEAVIAMKPDLIVAQSGTQGSQAKKLRDMGFKVIVTSVKSYEEVLEAYQAFGKILGSEEAAEKRIRQLEAKKQEILAKLPADKPSVAILYVTSKALAVKLDNSIAGDVVKILDMKNIASDLPADTIGSETTPLDIEYIVQQNPDYILVTSMISNNEAARKTMEEQFAKNPAWKGVKAVGEGRVIYLPQEYFLFNSGPYYGEAIEYIAGSIYPEIYGEVSSWYGK